MKKHQWTTQIIFWTLKILRGVPHPTLIPPIEVSHWDVFPNHTIKITTTSLRSQRVKGLIQTAMFIKAYLLAYKDRSQSCHPNCKCQSLWYSYGWTICDSNNRFKIQYIHTLFFMTWMDPENARVSCPIYAKSPFLPVYQNNSDVPMVIIHLRTQKNNYEYTVVSQ